MLSTKQTSGLSWTILHPGPVRYLGPPTAMLLGVRDWAPGSGALREYILQGVEDLAAVSALDTF